MKKTTPVMANAAGEELAPSSTQPIPPGPVPQAPPERERRMIEITIDGQLKFSKKQLGRFPEDAEIDALVGG